MRSLLTLVIVGAIAFILVGMYVAPSHARATGGSATDAPARSPSPNGRMRRS